MTAIALLIALFIAVLILWVFFLIKLVASGKTKLPGAKTRRKKYLSLFYGKASIFKKFKKTNEDKHHSI